MFLVPLLAYWPAISAEFGTRKDYVQLVGATTAPGSVVHAAGTAGTPVGGALLETALELAETVDGLRWLRLLGLALLIVVGLEIWRRLDNDGWPTVDSAVIGLALILTPAAQAIAVTASNWPLALAQLVAFGGFVAIESELEKGGLKRVVGKLGGCLIYVLALLMDRHSAAIMVIPLAALIFLRTTRSWRDTKIWIGTHAALLGISMVFAWLLLKLLYAGGVFQEAAASAGGSGAVRRLVDFFWVTMPNALSLFALRSRDPVSMVLYVVAALVVVGVIGMALRLELERYGRPAWQRWGLCLVAFPLLALAITLTSPASREYSTICTMSGLIVALVVASWRIICDIRQLKTAWIYAGYGISLALMVAAAWSHTAAQMADPLQRELSAMQSVVNRTNFKPTMNVFIVDPSPAYQPRAQVSSHEFGHLAASDAAGAKALFLAAVHQRIAPEQRAKIDLKVSSGASVPAGKTFDLVVDVNKFAAAN